jgi:hypothetical protein
VTPGEPGGRAGACPKGSGADCGPAISVAVVWATPRTQDVVDLRLPAGSTVGDALARSGLAGSWGFDPERVTFAVHGRRARRDAVLRDGDRVDVLRPLAVDPMDARRRRAETKPLPRGARRAGRGARGAATGRPPDER